MNSLIPISEQPQSNSREQNNKLYEITSQKRNLKKYWIFIAITIVIALGIYYTYSQIYLPYYNKKKIIDNYIEESGAINQNIYELSDNSKKNPAVKKYPNKLKSFLSDFETNSYKIGVEPILKRNFGDGNITSTWEDSWGDYFYFRNGILVRHETDVANAEYTESITPQATTVINIYNESNQTIQLWPTTKTYVVYDNLQNKSSPNITKTLGPILDIIKRLNLSEDLYETDKRDYYSFRKGEKTDVIFHVNPLNGQVDLIFKELGNNSSKTFKYHYVEVGSEEYSVIPEGYIKK